ncbi:LamG domain-containing protein [bacterium]|nr:LamG domain-containing protein [bacterium]
MKHLFFIFLVASLVVIFATMGYSAKLEGLLLLLLFEEGQGDVTKDISGNGYQGNISVGAKWTKGKFGNALEFNGKDGDVQVPGGVISSLPKSQISWGCWFYLTGHDAADGLVTMTGVVAPIAGQCCQYYLLVSTGLHPYYNVGEHNDKEINDFTFELKKWYHFAITYDGKVVKIYVDGKVIGEENKSIKLPEFETPVLIGTGEAPKVHPTQGIIDEVFIFDRALSEQEIKDIMQGFEKLLAVELSFKLPTAWGKIKAYHLIRLPKSLRLRKSGAYKNNLGSSLKGEF